eukprot:2726469-Rhodomonas_salina.1
MRGDLAEGSRKAVLEEGEGGVGSEADGAEGGVREVQRALRGLLRTALVLVLLRGVECAAALFQRACVQTARAAACRRQCSLGVWAFRRPSPRSRSAGSVDGTH